MDQPESEGVRLLSFDGGDIRAVSQLLILNEFMQRVEFDKGLTSRILPCEYFHMMGGVGTGGIIVMLLVTLRMGIEEAIEEFLNIWTSVFADASLDQAARSAKLEVTIKDLLQRRGLPENQKLYSGDGEESSCKAFVCVVPESNLGTCEKFRSYNSKVVSTSPTIVEAIRATCAIPTLFTPVSIESVGCHVSYVTGAYNFNNPAWETIKEACETFGQSRLVACVLSLGCGQRPTIRLSRKNKTTVMDLVNDIASDNELVDKDLAWRIGKSNVYYRLSVDRILESGGDSALGPVEDITSRTNGFLEHPTTAEKVNECTKASERLGRETLKDISGLSEPRLTTAYGLPSLSAFFVERPALIKKMAECLFRVGPPAQRRIVLSGMGGIGKTQITISFLHQFLSRFRHVLFIDASSVQRIESGVVAKVKSLSTTYSRTSAGEALDVLANPDHEITRDWAIVYDNVDNHDINIAEYFPRCLFGTIFLTTRNHNLGNLARHAHLRLDIMSEDEAADVLLRSAFDPFHLITEADEKHAREIAKELGYLPVALVQAGYFIKIHDCMHDYLGRLRKRCPDILSRPAQDQLDPHYHGVYATLNVTWPHLSLRAQNFMSILGFFNYTGFPIILLYRAAARGFLFEPLKLVDRPALFQQTIQLLCSTFRPHEQWDEQDVDDPVSELQKYSLVTPMTTFNVKTLRLHPLVHSWAHDRLQQAEKEVYRTAAIRLLVCGTSNDDEDIFEFIYPHTTLMSDYLENLHPNDQAGLAAVFAHQGDLKTAIELWEGIQRAVRALYSRDDLRPGEADLQLARLYWDTEDLEKRAAAPVLENEVVDIRKRTLGPNHPMTMLAVVQLASGMKRSRKQDDAASILKDALGFWESQPGDHWETILRVKEELAGCSYGDAITLCTEILQVRMERSGPDHHATLKAMENLARAYRFMSSRDDYDKRRQSPATDTWISVVAARTKARGIEHPDTLKAMETLARSYHQEEDFRKSVAQWKRVIDLRKAVQGIHHIDTLDAMEALQSIYGRHDDFHFGEHLETYQQKKLRKEIVCLRGDIVRLSKEAHGPSHKNTLEAMRELARMYERWEKYPEAEKQWKEIVSLTKEAQGPNHQDTLRAMTSLAHPYEAWRKHPEAEEQWKEIVSLVKEARGPNHEDTLQSTQELVRLYEDWGKKTEEEETRILIVRLTKEARGPSHQDTLKLMSELASTYEHWGKYNKAAGQWEEIVRLTKETLGPNHEDTLHAMKALARICNPWKSYTEVEGQWKEIVSLTREVRGPNHEDTLQAMKELANVYEDWEKNTKAEEKRKEIVCLAKEAQGPNHWGTLNAIRELAQMYERWSKYPEATVQWEEIVFLAKYESNPDAWSARHDMRALAGMYERCERYTEAAAQWEKKIIQLKNDDWDKLHDLGTLARMYEGCQQYAKAAVKWEEIVRLTKDAHNPIHTSEDGRIHDDNFDAIAQLAKTSDSAKLLTEWETQMKEDVRLASEAKGPSHEDTIKAMRGLAKLYQAWRKFAESEGQWKEIVRLTRDAKDRISWDTLHYMRDLANMYETHERYIEAIAQLEEILRLRKGATGCQYPQLIREVTKSLAEIYEKVGREDEAMAQREETARLRKDIEGPSDWDILHCMKGLARMYETREQYTEVVAKWEEIAQWTKGVDGLINDDTLDAVAQLAKIRDSPEVFTEWETQVKEDVRLAREAKGPAHEDTIKAMRGLAKLYQAWRKFAESEDQWKEIIRLTKDAKGPNSWNTLRYMRDLANMYQGFERYTEAIAQLEEILRLEDGDEYHSSWFIYFAEIYEGDGLDEEVAAQCEKTIHFDKLRNMETLARIYEKCEQYTKAAVKWEEIVQLEKSSASVYYWVPLDSMKSLARIYERCEEYNKAGAKWEEIVRLTKEARTPIHAWDESINDDTLDAIAQLVKIRDSPEVFTEWETQVKEDVRLAREAKGPAHEDTIKAMRGLAKLYQAWRKFAESGDQWKEIIRLTKEAEGPSGGPSGWNTLGYMRDLAKMYEGCEQYTEAVAQLEEVLCLEEDDGYRSSWLIKEDTKSLEEIHKKVERVGRAHEVVAPREEIKVLPEDSSGYSNGGGERDILRQARHLANGYEKREEYTKAAGLWEDILHLEEYDENLEEYGEYFENPGKRIYDAKSLAKMYMKLERYEAAETLLLDARDQVPWEREEVKAFRKLLEEVRSKLANTNASSTT